MPPETKKADIFIRVLTYLPDADDPESDLIINYSDVERRTWLLKKHLFWAVLNNRTVEIFNVKDA
jgi:hypothetical protein